MSESNGEWGQLAKHDDEMADHWDELDKIPESGVNLALDAFIESKGITRRALVRLGARMAADQVLAFAFEGGIKYRDILTGRRWSFHGSEFTALKIVKHGVEPAEDIIVAEGETDAAWLSDRLSCDVAVLPGGADPRPHVAAYVAQLVSYKRVALGQDNDRAGDEGAAVFMEKLPQAFRYPPLEGAADWCALGGRLPPMPEFPEPQPEQRVVVTWDEARDIEPPPIYSWYENGLLPIAGSLILHGWAKSFKSFISIDLLAALSQCQPWCLFEPTEEPCRVCVMQYEIPWPYFQQRLRQVEVNAAEPQLFRENFLIWTPQQRPGFRAGNTEYEDFIIRTLTDNDVNVFMLDPVRRATGTADLNSEKEVRPLLAFYERLMDNGITVITCHHDNKTYARGGGGDPLGMTGAGAFAGDFDTIVSVSLPKGLSLEEPQRNLSFTTRNAPTISSRGMSIGENGRIEYSLHPHGREDDEPTNDNPGEPKI